MAVIIERIYPQEPDPEAVKRIAQVILKIGQRLLNDQELSSKDAP